MKIIGQGKVTGDERELIVKTTDKELRLLTENPTDYRQTLKVGDEINISKKYELFNQMQRYGNAILNDFDGLRNVFIDIGLGGMKEGDSD
ncbi:hypothetical protein VQL36_05420 [Chengkuizengella sp. SCS-71B]|uniref:hypothetical protein n=1 Tax=Chengkuizengella sp. SCS-71B TaxID=3115290 RepID=UPI0032C232A1